MPTLFYNKIKINIQMDESQWRIETAFHQSRLIHHYGLHSLLIATDFQIDQQTWVHALVAGSTLDPTLLLIHGYSGNCLMFVHMLEQLALKFRVISIDLPGTGRSSRQSFQPDNLEEAIGYFTEKLQKLRKKLNLENWIILGHSMGGMLATYYAQQYPTTVKELWLLSPLGMYTASRQQRIAEMQQRTNDSWSQKIRFKVMKWVTDWRVTPSGVISNCLLGNLLISRALTNRLNMQGDQLQLWKNYFKALAKVSPNSQQCLYFFMDWPFTTVRPLMPILAGLQVRKRIFYGTNDWMYTFDGRKAFKQQQEQSKNGLQSESKLQVQFVVNCGHQMMFEQPQAILQKLGIIS